MKIITLGCAALAALATPAAAQSLTDTHQLRWAPAGKLPAARLHPVRDVCRTIAAPAHLAGKGQLVVRTAAPNCATRLAAADDARRSASTSAR